MIGPLFELTREYDQELSMEEWARYAKALTPYPRDTLEIVLSNWADDPAHDRVPTVVELVTLCEKLRREDIAAESQTRVCL